VSAVRDASTSSCHLATLIGAGLLLAVAIVNAVGIRNPTAQQPSSAETETAAA